MFGHFIRLFFFFTTAAAVPNVANYAPVPVVIPAPSTYGSPYVFPYGQSNQGQVQVIDSEQYGVPELLPAVSQVTNPPKPFIPQPIPPPPFQPPTDHLPLAVSVPVNQPVGFTQQVTVTNPQVISQGYAPPPQIAPAPSAYGAPSPAYGAIPNNLNQQLPQGFNQQQIPFERLPSSQNFAPGNGQVSGVASPNGITETDDNLDTWSEIGQAQGVKIKKSRIPRVRIH